MTLISAISGMLVGAVTVLLWIYLPITVDGQSLSAWLYEIVPGFVLSSLTIVVISLVSKQTDSSIINTFEKVEKTLHDSANNGGNAS